MSISNSTQTKNYKILKEEAKQQCRTTLEFCVWFDYEIVSLCNLELKPFDTIMQLINDEHIINDKKLKPFRLACIIMQKFVNSDHNSNMARLEEFINDFPQYKKPKKKYNKCNSNDIYNYDRVAANSILFPYFVRNGLSRQFIAMMVARGFLAYDEVKNNIVYVCQYDYTIHGIERHGMFEKHYMELEFTDPYKPYPFMFWNQYEEEEFISFKKDVKHVIFYDETLYMLQDIAKDSLGYTLYCSLHSPNPNIDIYKNTLEFLPENIKISFNFFNKEKEQAFLNKVKLQETESEVAVTQQEDIVDDTVLEQQAEVHEDYEANKQILIDLLKNNLINIDNEVYSVINDYIESDNKVYSHSINNFIEYIRTGDDGLLEEFYLPF